VSLALADVPAEIAHMAHAFPIRLPMFDVSHLSTWMLENCLPPFPVAWSLVENYWEHFAWQCVYELLLTGGISIRRRFTPMTRPWFVKQIFSPLYHRSPGSSDSPLGHRLGLLFMVFSVVTLLTFGPLTIAWLSGVFTRRSLGSHTALGIIKGVAVLPPCSR
jgi:hypothetical protein